mgnify:CR=1 FL=1
MTVLNFEALPNGRMKHSKVAQDPAAIEMRSQFDALPNTMQMFTSWQGGSDEVSITPTWAGELQGVGEITEGALAGLGWQGTRPNGNLCQMVDLQDTKIADYLGGFAGDGIKILQWFPVASISDNSASFGFEAGYWVAEEFILGGAYNDFTWVTQPDESADPDVTQDVWVPGSIPTYHKTKRHNFTNGNKYRCGKDKHLPAPLAVFWTTSPLKLKGYVVGELRVVGDRLYKLYPMAQLAPLVSVSDQVSVDATVGYLSEGGSSFTFVDLRTYTSGPYTFPDCTLDNFYTYSPVDGYLLLGGLLDTGVYSDNSGVPNSLLAATGTPRGYDQADDPAAKWYRFAMASEAISAGDHHIAFLLTNRLSGAYRYDNSGTYNSYNDLADVGSALPATFTGSIKGGREISHYFEVTEGGGGNGSSTRKGIGFGFKQIIGG